MNAHNPESRAMKFFRRLGMESVAWSLRRLHCPVDDEALVLEVGSGGNPYARANVLLDAYEATGQRHWVPLTTDRPLVLGFAERLPFKDKAFDFVIASHVLEHSLSPERFLAELMRVARAGYIEVPDAFMERINPYEDHRLEITDVDGRLVIRKKPAWIIEPDTVRLYEHKVKPLLTARVMTRYPFRFHVRYFWKDRIDFTVINPDIRPDWPDMSSQRKAAPVANRLKPWMRSLLVNALRWAYSQNRRNRKLDWHRLLACPACRSGALAFSPHEVSCDNCAMRYPVSNGVPVMNVTAGYGRGDAQA